MARTGCAGVILAGGQSRRMQGVTKSLLELAGRPLLQHVIDRVAPQVGRLFLSVEQPMPDLDSFHLPQLSDPRSGHQGPLCGLLAALREIAAGAEEWLLLAPCDAPLLPKNLASRLLKRAVEEDRPGAVVRFRGELQPTFSVWHVSQASQLERAVLEQNMAGFKQYLEGDPLAVLDWPDQGDDPFFNINDPAALEESRRRLDPGNQ